MSKARSNISERDIRQWFARTEELLTKNDCAAALADPSRVYNTDETAIYLNPQGGKFIGQKGRPTVRINENDDKANLTILFTVSADGQQAPPFILFKCKRLPKSVGQNIPLHWGFSANENGWMTAEKFYGYVANVFHPFLERNNIQRPVILFMDGHSSHISLPLSDFCVQNKIILVCLIASATHILQPLDVGFFRPLKVYWRKCARLYRVKNNHDIKKEDVANQIELVLRENDARLKTAIQNGFRTTGLYPFDVNNVNFERHTLRKDKTDISDTTVDSPAETRLQIYESLVPPNILEQFRLARQKGTWSGDEDLKAWFNSWVDLHSREESFVEYHVGTNCSRGGAESYPPSASTRNVSPGMPDLYGEDENEDPDGKITLNYYYDIITIK